MQENYKQHEDVTWCQDWRDICHYLLLPNFRSSQEGERSIVPAFFLEEFELFTSLSKVQATQESGECTCKADHLDHY